MPWLLLFCLQDVGRFVEEATRESALRGGRVGISILSTQTGAILYEKNATAPLVLASNTKLLTTAAALVRLGPDFRFTTVLGLQGRELHVFGGGDPNISGRFHDDDPTAIFRTWARRLLEANVTRVDALVLHDGFFDRVTVLPEWISEKYDQDQWWCAPIGALSLNDNCVDLLYQSGDKEGDPVRIRTRPDTGFVTLVNRAKTSGQPSPPFGFVRRDGTNEIIAKGELAPKSSERVAWVAIQDPTGFFGAVLKESLERAGIVVGDVRRAETVPTDYPDLRVLVTHESDLATALRVCNTVSQNFHAEMICKTLGAKCRGAGTTAAGISVVREFLETDLGIRDGAQADGSGLARANRLSTASMVRLLDHMRGHVHAKTFVESLAVNAAESGTLRRRMRSIKGAVRGKTGHIQGVSALSGYLETAAGDTLVFSIVCNDWSGGSPDRFQDRLLERLHALKGD
ncbi:MAG: D-alanyl-D-alanine carboxypeptidase/D-alanyl-D-alanine-endopeptidase [Planctomycetes bacterium]|nr:D-alanyl-D-alanine carboxypeptidase/D-alanyl-D-alanine-endopeptidase [Planctomycetota bacterium]